MYEFSFVSFFIGLGLMALSVVFVRYHAKISDMFGTSMSRTQLAAFICVGVSFLVMLNIPALLGKWLAQAFFGGMR